MLRWALTTPQSIVPALEYRAATAVNVNSYWLQGVRIEEDGTTTTVRVVGLGGAGDMTEEQLLDVVLDAAHQAAAFKAHLSAAAMAKEIRTEVTATGGTTSTVSLSTATWTTDALVGVYIILTGGTNGNVNESVKIQVLANTATSITFNAAFAAACDNTTKFKLVHGIYESFRREFLTQAMDQEGLAGGLA